MIALKVDETLPRLTPEVEIVLYRAVQEGLTNVIRHASAHGVEIELMQHHEMIILTIADDGKGIESEHQNEGLGLSGMRERVALVDGNLHIESTAGKGTRIKIELQVDRGQADDNTNQGAAGG